MTDFTEHRYAVIMAGGAGTRLWPMSRKSTPKQLIPFIERDEQAKSLLQLAVERATRVVPIERVFICTGQAYIDQIATSLPQVPRENLLGEPEGRDTTSAVGFAAAVLEKHDPDAVFCILTADHIIEPVDVFAARMAVGFSLVEAEPSRLVTFSIQPTYPATGFGYVQRAHALADPGATYNGNPIAFSVERFVEKPNEVTAKQYLVSGDFGWNSGMFVWRASTIMQRLHKHMPAIYNTLRAIQQQWGTSAQQETLCELYPTLEKKSIDYAVMEPASRESPSAVCTVLMDLSWLDVGSWPSYAETLVADSNNNRASGVQVVSENSSGNLVAGQAGHTVAMLGCSDLIVITTPNATLIMPRDRAEDLKKIHAKLPDDLK
ncbi:MAG: NTP transferase domain-containing protein [Phycisphaeraceae bacterium]|nr:NTP transferase domain-containing protein [Phycisphaerales bacterium]MCB9859312.1 NTP transferase domain-containing protein [Phycisphaeraceae bacterium]